MSNKEKKFGDKLRKAEGVAEKILRFLHIRPAVGGMEVTDQLIRLAYFDGTAWQFRGVRLEPGVAEAGRIKDEPSFVAALAALRSQVPELAKSDHLMSVVVSLSSASIYNQIFNLPFITGKSFETAMTLNLQMSSSVDAAESYSGWEIISENESSGRIEALGAFADRAMVDAMTNTLFLGGFVTTTVESKALAVARIMREYGSGIDSEKSYLVSTIDDSGLDFIIVRRGQLCFEYMNPWRDLADEKGEITTAKFVQSFTLGLNQVVNFYRQHWTEPMAAVILSGDAFVDEARAAIATAETVPVMLLEDALGGKVPGSWAVALGSGLRGAVGRGKDREITFLGEGAKELFENSRVLNFLSFWRVAVPVVLGILVAVFVATDVFLQATGKSAASYSASATAVGVGTDKEMTDLVAQARTFNSSVAMIASLEPSSTLRYAIIQAISTAADQNDIAITRITLPSDEEPILVAGQAQSEDTILAFKSAIEQTPGFGTVNLPLAGIQGGGSSYSFSMTFSEVAASTTVSPTP
jgi:hypothetical protein